MQQKPLFTDAIEIKGLKFSGYKLFKFVLSIYPKS